MTDLVRFYQQKWKNRAKNAAFKKAHPDVVLPPDYLMYESFQLDYARYLEGGKASANWILGHLRRHTELAGKDILDWGCGPGRIIRHLPELVGNDCTFSGTDYNARSVEWCSEHLKGITFMNNGLEPPIPAEPESFDVIYAISIFTHLSERLHFAWLEELLRVARPGATLLLTFQGDGFRPKLTPEELEIYDRGAIVVRGQVKEGHRIFSAFHPPAFMQNFFQHVEILEHVPGETVNGKPEQDVWIIRKPA